ncbi:MAG: prepilin peptidase [Actinomycetota bacterium]
MLYVFCYYEAMSIWMVIFLFVLGLSVGSFLNVVIYRLPRKESLITPPSSCPNCHIPIKWYDNIPVVSFIILRGRCRNCGQRISLRYPIVELFTGILFVFVFLKVVGVPSSTFDGPPPPSIGYQEIIRLIAYLFFVSILVAIAYIDAEHQVIPNRIVYPSFVIGSALIIIADPGNFLFYLAGFAVGGGLLFLISLFKEGGMGGGDVKLAALMGIFLGLQVLLALFIGFLVGAIVGITLALFKKRSIKEPIAFGPFLALGGLITLFYGTPIINLYLRLILS